MSRSYRKYPMVKYGINKQGKKFANKKVRRTANIGDHCSYKRVYESYDIFDGCSSETWGEYLYWAKQRDNYGYVRVETRSEDEMWKDYCKCYYWK